MIVIIYILLWNRTHLDGIISDICFSLRYESCNQMINNTKDLQKIVSNIFDLLSFESSENENKGNDFKFTKRVHLICCIGFSNVYSVKSFLTIGLVITNNLVISSTFLLLWSVEFLFNASVTNLHVVK